MAILAFECARFSLSLALLTRSQDLFFEEIKELKGQDQALFPKMLDLLDRAHLSFEDLDFLVTTTGPGSFTGIRMALAAARGLHLATGVPLRCIDSFSFVAKSYLMSHPNPGTDIHICLESRRAEKFYQLFNAQGAPIGEPLMVVGPDDVYQQGPRIGDGWAEESYQPTARELALLALKDHSAFQEKCDPFYVRAADVTIKK